MWQREGRRYHNGNTKTTENPRQIPTKDNADMNARTSQQHAKQDIQRESYQRNMPQNNTFMSSPSGMIAPRAISPAPHSSPSSFPRDFNQRNMYQNNTSMSSPTGMISPGSRTSLPPMQLQNMGHQHMPQQNMRLQNMSQKNIGSPNMSQHNMVPPNMSQHNMGPQNNLPPVFMNGPPINVPPPGFNNINVPPPGFNDNRIPSNLPPPPVPGPYVGLPTPDNTLMGGSMPPPCNIPPPMNIEHNNMMGMPHLLPSIISNQGGMHVQQFSSNQINSQRGLEQEDSRFVDNEDSETRTLDQAWVDKFLQERQLKTVKKQKEKPKVGEAKEILQKWFQVVNKIEVQRDKLAECIKSGDSEWQRELQKANFLKEELDQVEVEFSSQFDMDSLLNEINKKRKKREWQKKRKKTLAVRKKEMETKNFELHLQIDQWREKEIAKAKAKFKAASMKQEAGGVLGDVRRKQADSSRSLSLIQAIRKLRSFRKQEAEVKGVYQKPTTEQSREFERRLEFLEKLMQKHHELYESEEKALVVMLAEEEEEKEKERREKKHTKQLAEAAASDSSDPMREFYRYYTQAENGLDSLLHIRHGWDMYIVPETLPGASCIPQGEVLPVSPTSKIWAAFLQDSG